MSRLVRRDHLHAGMTECARRNGVKLLVGSRVEKLSYSKDSVEVVTTQGAEHTFDLLIGSDGIKSTIRQSLFPNVAPQAASTVAAFRGILSYEEVFSKFPETRQVLRNTMDSWIGPNGYVLLYPLSGGRELNVVTLFNVDYVVKTPEDIDVDEFRNLYKDWNPMIQKVLSLVNYTQKWPLLVLPPMKTWSNEHKNVVLLGDAAHCMQNHLVPTLSISHKRMN
jgi:2-polyprenyl-6-methoxyphenol hydroxylase-like FAD-dependent oxidoreductase